MDMNLNEQLTGGDVIIDDLDGLGLGPDAGAGAARNAGRSLVSYCITAGDQTVFLIQAFDYAGPGNPDVDRAKARVGAEVRKAASAR